MLNGDQLLWTDAVTFLGIHLTNDMDDKLDIFNKRGDFYGRVNSLLASFGGLPCNILNDLFCSYCSSFYGSQRLLRCKELTYLFSAYNRAVRRLWRIPRNSHRYIVYVLSSRFSLQKQLEKRFLNMFDAMLMSENKLVRFIAHRSLSDYSCDLGNNYAYIVQNCYCLYCYGFSRHAYLDLKSHND